MKHDMTFNGVIIQILVLKYLVREGMIYASLSLSLSLSLSWWISLQTLVLKHFVREGMLQEFCLGEPLKNFNKKIEYIELLTQKKKKMKFYNFLL